MTGNEKYDNDAGRTGVRTMLMNRHSSENSPNYQMLNGSDNSFERANTLTKDAIKVSVEDFFAKHDEKELSVSVFLDTEGKKPICNFHIDSEYREIVEDSTKSQLIISDFTTPKSLILDDVTIRYDEVTKCNPTVRTGETEDDIVADVLEIMFKNGTVLELGFLYI